MQDYGGPTPWKCVFNVIKTQAAVAEVFRKIVPDGQISIALDSEWAVPFSDSQEDKVRFSPPSQGSDSHLYDSPGGSDPPFPGYPPEHTNAEKEEEEDSEVRSGGGGEERDRDGGQEEGTWVSVCKHARESPSPVLVPLPLICSLHFNDVEGPTQLANRLFITQQ
jgi:hypothetical protein